MSAAPAGNITKLGVKAISDAIGIEIKPEHVASANKKMRAYGFKVGVLTQLAATADPHVQGGDSVSLAQCIMNVPFNTGTKYAEEAALVDFYVEPPHSLSCSQRQIQCGCCSAS